MVGNNIHNVSLCIAQAAAPVDVGVSYAGLLILCGVIAAIVLLAKYKPPALLWIGALFLLLVFFLGVPFFAYQRSSTIVQAPHAAELSPSRTDRSFQSFYNGAPFPAATPAAGDFGELSRAQAQLRTFRWGFTGRMVLLLLIVIGIFLVSRVLNSNRRAELAGDDRELWQDEPGRRRGPLVGILVGGGVALLLFMLAGIWVARSRVNIAEHQRLMAQARQQFEAARLQATNNIDTIMDEFDKPRIVLPPPPTQSAPSAVVTLPQVPNSTAAHVDEKKLSADEALQLLGETSTDTADAAQDGSEADKEEAAAAQAEAEVANDETAHATPDATPADSGKDDEQTTAEENAVAVEEQTDAGTQLAEEPAEEPAAMAAPLPAAAVAPPLDVLRIQFSRSRISSQGLSFGQVVTSFLSNWNEANGPVNVNNENLTIEVNRTATAAKDFAGMSVRTRVGGNVQLSALTSTVSTISPARRRPNDGTPPAWLKDPPHPHRVGDVWRQVVAAGDYATVEDCYRRADEMLYEATWEHLQRVVGRLPGRYNGMNRREQLELEYVGIDMNFIRTEIIPADGEYLEMVERSVGPMYKLSTLMEFTPQVNARLKSMWSAREQFGRVVAVSSTAGLTLAFVGLLFGLLKIDTWTKGYYTKRLFFAAALVATGIFGLFALMVS